MCWETSINSRKQCDNSITSKPLTISFQNLVTNNFDREEIMKFRFPVLALRHSLWQFSFVLEYCGTRAIPNVETSDYLLTLGSKLNPKINIMWTGNVSFCVTLCPLLFALIRWFLNCCQHVLFHLAVLVKDTDSWFFYAWLKVQLHLSFFFPASMIASQPFNIVQNSGIVHGFHI